MNVLLIIIIVLLIALLLLIKFTKIGQKFFCPGETTTPTPEVEKKA